MFLFGGHGFIICVWMFLLRSWGSGFRVLAVLLWARGYILVGKHDVVKEVSSMSWNKDALEAEMHFEQIKQIRRTNTDFGFTGPAKWRSVLYSHFCTPCAATAETPSKSRTENVHFSHIVSLFTTAEGGVVHQKKKDLKGKNTFVTAVHVVYWRLDFTSGKQLGRAAFEYSNIFQVVYFPKWALWGYLH